MLIQSVHFTFAPENADTAEAMLRELREASRKEEGVIGFDVARSRDTPGVFALWEQYRVFSYSLRGWWSAIMLTHSSVTHGENDT